MELMDRMYRMDRMDFSGGSASAVTSPCEDIWKKFDDFLLTPPQSPPIKFELVSDTFDDMIGDLALNGPGSGLPDEAFSPTASAATIGSIVTCTDAASLSAALPMFHNLNVDVLHDCMWSGQCFEDCFGGSLSRTTCGMSCAPIGSRCRPETPLLSTSPLALSGCSFSEILSSCSPSEMDVDEEDDEEREEEEDSDDEKPETRHSSSQGSLESGSTGSSLSSTESLMNEHSYGSPGNSPRPSNQSQSLIYPSPSYRKQVLTRARNGVKCRKVLEKELSVLSSPQVTVKFVKRSSSSAKENSSENSSKKPVKGCKSLNASAKKLKVKSCSQSSRPSVQTPKSLKGGHSVLSSTVKSCPSSPAASSFSMPTCSSSSPSSQTSSSSTSSGLKGNLCPKSERMYPERRREHNDSERKRRDHLRNAFHSLRDQIPKLKEAQKKPARITILHEATSYVALLSDKHRYLEKTKGSETQKRERLLKRLAQLQVDTD